MDSEIAVSFFFAGREAENKEVDVRQEEVCVCMCVCVSHDKVMDMSWSK